MHNQVKELRDPVRGGPNKPPRAKPANAIHQGPNDTMWVPTSTSDFPHVAGIAEALQVAKSPHRKYEIINPRRDLVLSVNSGMGPMRT